MTLEKENHNDVGTKADFRQKKNVKNASSLQLQYLVGKSTSKTQRVTTLDFGRSNYVGNTSLRQRCFDVVRRRDEKIIVNYEKTIFDKKSNLKSAT